MQLPLRRRPPIWKLAASFIAEIFMRGTAKALLGFGLLLGTHAALAQTYNMDLTGVGNGTVADGVYVTPYVGTITGNGLNYSGFVICDDFNHESYLNSPWTATETGAGALDGGERFTFNGNAVTAQQAYNAAGWLANGLLANYGTSAQTDYAFAIWNIFDNGQLNPNGGSLALEQAAFTAANNGYVASNVSVFTPTSSASTSPQEFLVVNPAPEIDPTLAGGSMTLLFGGALILRSRRKREC
jgi:hypothetical protein